MRTPVLQWQLCPSGVGNGASLTTTMMPVPRWQRWHGARVTSAMTVQRLHQRQRGAGNDASGNFAEEGDFTQRLRHIGRLC